jgi:hypothetical protein
VGNQLENTKAPSPRLFLEKQFRKLTLLRGVPDEPEAIKAWAELMTRVLDDVGTDRFERAVMKLLTDGGFFPKTPDEIRAAVPHEKLITCPVCENSSGYVIVKVMKAGKFTECAVKCKHGGE